MLSNTPLPQAAIIMGSQFRHIVYTEAVEAGINDIANIVIDTTAEGNLSKHAEELAGVELLFTSWDAPRLDEPTLALMPALRGVFNAAGSIRSFVTDAFWERNIPICSAPTLNAIPVAEYTFAQIILCLKQSYHLAQLFCRHMSYNDLPKPPARIGSYGALVGLVSMGEIARQLLKRLHTLDVQVQVYDPYLSPQAAKELGVTLVDLSTLFRTSDVVSLHTPWLPETEGMITGSLLESLKAGAAFINTARGAVVDQQALERVLTQRPDIQAVIDVTYPEPPPAASPLYTLPNVFLTPHIAGSLDRECARMGHAMADEARRLLNGEPLRLQVTQESYARMA